MPVAAMSIARCGASWAASTHSSAPCACASSASCSSGHTSPVTLDAPVTARMSIPGSMRSASASSCSGDSGNGIRRRSCSRHGSMFAWCSIGVESTFVPDGSECAMTLSASVVLRTNTDAAVLGADEPRDAPARLLIRVGRDPRLRAGPAVDARVERHERLDGIPHRGHHRRAGRVVEVHVAPHAAVGARHLDVVSDEPVRWEDRSHSHHSHMHRLVESWAVARTVSGWFPDRCLTGLPHGPPRPVTAIYEACFRPLKISATWPPPAPPCWRCCSRCSALPRCPTSARDAASRGGAGAWAWRAGAHAGAAARRLPRSG